VALDVLLLLVWARLALLILHRTSSFRTSGT
jgi:hypothetical protein